jgi:hypothetical protein
VGKQEERKDVGVENQGKRPEGWENVGLSEKMTLNWILKKREIQVWSETRRGQSAVAGFCGHGKGPPGSVL